MCYTNKTALSRKKKGMKEDERRNGTYMETPEGKEAGESRLSQRMKLVDN